MQVEVRELKSQIADRLTDASVAAQVAKDPATEVPRLVQSAASDVPAYRGDKWLYRLAVSVLGALALVAAVGAIWLVVNGKTTPESVVALGSASVGALVGLFATPPSKT